MNNWGIPSTTSHIYLIAYIIHCLQLTDEARPSLTYHMCGSGWFCVSFFLLFFFLFHLQLSATHHAKMKLSTVIFQSSASLFFFFLFFWLKNPIRLAAYAIYCVSEFCACTNQITTIIIIIIVIIFDFTIQLDRLIARLLFVFIYTTIQVVLTNVSVYDFDSSYGDWLSISIFESKSVERFNYKIKS